MKLVRRILSLKKCLPKMGLDVLLFAAAYVLAYVVRLDVIEYPYDVTLMLTIVPVVLLKLAVFHYVGAYRGIWHYSGLEDLKLLVWGTALSGAAVATMGFLVPRELSPPRTVPFIDAVLTLLLTGGTRMLVRIVYEYRNKSGEDRPVMNGGMTRPEQQKSLRALVVGAGDTGEAMVRQILRHGKLDYEPVAFVDDDPAKTVMKIHGVPVLGRIDDIPWLVRDLNVQEILIAVPSAPGRMIQKVVKLSKNTPATLKIVPDRRTDRNGVNLAQLRNLSVEDLLGREPIDLDLSLISGYLREKRVMVTGAGGSIGSELCRQILRFAPSELHLLGRGENSIYEIHEELNRWSGSTRLVEVIGDVINKRKLEGIVKMLRPEIIFHAGADKHVPLMELNPDEAVLNNIVGTKNVLEVADSHGVERVVCVSTDKAVEPTSVMGCSKRVGELLVQSGMYTNTIAVAVRFANVLASRGSVIPLFKKQIEEGGPVTVTDREITRYFMTIPEAAGLVIQAGAMGRGEEIFVLDMGAPLKIWDLAHSMLRLSGLEPGSDVEIEEIGLRPGEKLNEELVYPWETKLSTAHEKIVCVRGKRIDVDDLLKEIEDLTKSALLMNPEAIRAGLRRLVPEYAPSGQLQKLSLAAEPRMPARPAVSKPPRQGYQRWVAKHHA